MIMTYLHMFTLKYYTKVWSRGPLAPTDPKQEGRGENAFYEVQSPAAQYLSSLKSMIARIGWESKRESVGPSNVSGDETMAQHRFQLLSLVRSSLKTQINILILIFELDAGFIYVGEI